MKKWLNVLLSGVMVAALLGGCAGEKTANNGEVSISVGNWPTEDRASEVEKYEAQKAKFEAANPGIKIVPDTWKFDLQTFMPQASSGQLPTLFNVAFTEVNKIMDIGYAADITKEFTEMGFADALNESLRDMVSKDGKIYGIPTSAYTMGLYIDMPLFREAGLVNADGTPMIPDTYEELAETAKTIKEKTGKPGFIMPTTNNQGGWHFMNIAWSYGTEFMKQDESGKWIATFASPEGEAALQYVKDLKWKYNALPDNALTQGDELNRSFATDQVGMVMGEPEYFSRTAIEVYGMDRNNISIAKLPKGPKGRYALLGGSVNMIEKDATSEQISAVLKWLDAGGSGKSVTDEVRENTENAYKIDAEKGLIVGIPKPVQVWNSPEQIALQDEMMAKYKNIDDKMFASYADAADVKIKAEEPMNCQELYKILDSCIQQVLLDENADVKAILEKAQSDFQRNYLDRNN